MQSGASQTAPPTNERKVKMLFENRELLIRERNSKTKKGIDKDKIKVGDNLMTSQNLSTGDRSTCDCVVTVLSINDEKTHMRVKFKNSYDIKDRESILMLSEYEFYSSKGL